MLFAYNFQCVRIDIVLFKVVGAGERLQVSQY